MLRMAVLCWYKTFNIYYIIQLKKLGMQVNKGHFLS